MYMKGKRSHYLCCLRSSAAGVCVKQLCCFHDVMSCVVVVATATMTTRCVNTVDRCVFTVLHDNQLTHTDLKPENILFVSSDADIIYDSQKVGVNAAVGDFNADSDRHEAINS